MAKITMHSLPAELTDEEIAELEAAEKIPISFDEDCPEMTAHLLDLALNDTELIKKCL